MDRTESQAGPGGHVAKCQPAPATFFAKRLSQKCGDTRQIPPGGYPTAPYKRLRDWIAQMFA